MKTKVCWGELAGILKEQKSMFVGFVFLLLLFLHSYSYNFFPFLLPLGIRALQQLQKLPWKSIFYKIHSTLCSHDTHIWQLLLVFCCVRILLRKQLVAEMTIWTTLSCWASLLKLEKLKPLISWMRSFCITKRSPPQVSSLSLHIIIMSHFSIISF